MAKNNLLLVPFVVLSLLVASSYGRSTIKISEGDVNEICRGEQDPSFCFNFFKSTPRAKTSNLPGVLQLLIKVASKNALDTEKQFKSLFKSAHDQNSKSTYSLCAELYDDAFSAFDDALQSLKEKDGFSVQTHISAVLASADTCQDELSNVKLTPRLIKTRSLTANFTSIALSVSAMLPRD